MVRLLISSWCGMGNVGDDALASLAMARLSEQHDCSLLLEPQAANPFRELPSLRWPSVKASPLHHRTFSLRVRSDFDAVIFAGGGWLSGDQGLRSPARWAFRMQLLPVPVAGLGLGVGPFPTLSSAYAARHVLSRFGMVTVRTGSDAHWAYRLTGHVPRVTSDPILAIFNAGFRRPVTRSGRTIVAVPSPREHWLPRSLHGAFLEGIAAHIRELQADGGEVALVDFQASDSAALHSLVSTTPIEATSSPWDFLQVFADADAAIVGRLHAGLIAALVRTPVCAIGYHHKFEVLQGLGVPSVAPGSVVGRYVPGPVAPDISAMAMASVSANSGWKDIASWLR